MGNMRTPVKNLSIRSHDKSDGELWFRYSLPLNDKYGSIDTSTIVDYIIPLHGLDIIQAKEVHHIIDKIFWHDDKRMYDFDIYEMLESYRLKSND